LRSNHSALLNKIRDSGDLTDKDDAELKNILDAFMPETGLLPKAEWMDNLINNAKKWLWKK